MESFAINIQWNVNIDINLNLTRLNPNEIKKQDDAKRQIIDKTIIKTVFK